MVKAKRIRFGLDGEFRKTTVNNDDLTLAELELMAQRIFKLSPTDTIKIKYKDEDDVMVTIGDDTELQLAMEDFEILKFAITLNEGKEETNAEQASQKAIDDHPAPSQQQQQPKQVENIHEFDPLSSQQNHHFSQPSPPPPPPVMNGPGPHSNQHVPPPPPQQQHPHHPHHPHQPLPHQQHPPLMNGPPPPQHLLSQGPPPQQQQPQQHHVPPSPPQQHQLPPPPPQQQHIPQAPPQQQLPPHQQQQHMQPPQQQQQQQQQGQAYNPPPPPPQYMRNPIGAGGAPPLQPPVHQGGYAPNPYSARKRYPS